MFSRSDFDNINERLQKITESPVEQINIEMSLPPTIKELEDNNKAYVIQAAILFIDIRKSTYLTENSQAKSMVKIYRAFIRLAVDCVRKNDGVTRQFLGDRIMGVFMDSIGENNIVTEKAVDKAVNCARSLQTVIDYSLNKCLKSNVNGKNIECGIGIDYGKILVTKVGMYGVESNQDKEDEWDCVWVGNTTNHASKYSDIAEGGETFISQNVYRELSESLKGENVWQKSAKYKGTKLFEGYVTQDYYLDFIKELGDPVKLEQDNTSAQDSSFQLAEGIQTIAKLQDDLLQKSKDLVRQHEKLEQRDKCITNYGNIIYYQIRDLMDAIYNGKRSIDSSDIDFCTKVISSYFSMGKSLGKDEDDIKKSIDYYLVSIYESIGMYINAFEMMKYMAENDSWVYLPYENKTLLWAKEEGRLHELSFEIKWRIENCASEIDVSEFETYLAEVEAVESY